MPKQRRIYSAAQLRIHVHTWALHRTCFLHEVQVWKMGGAGSCTIIIILARKILELLITSNVHIGNSKISVHYLDIERSLLVWSKIDGWPWIYLFSCCLSCFPIQRGRFLPWVTICHPGPSQVQVTFFPH